MKQTIRARRKRHFNAEHQHTRKKSIDLEFMVWQRLAGLAQRRGKTLSETIVQLIEDAEHKEICHANDHVKAGFTGVIRQEVTLKGVVTQTRAKNPATRGFLSDGNLSLRLSYHVFNAFNFDLYATIRSQAIDQGSARFHVVTGVAGNRVRFAHTTCGDFVRRNTFGDQVINRLSTFLDRPVVSVRTDTVSEAQNDNGTVFRIQVAQLAVQLIQSLLAFRLQWQIC